MHTQKIWTDSNPHSAHRGQQRATLSVAKKKLSSLEGDGKMTRVDGLCKHFLKGWLSYLLVGSSFEHSINFVICSSMYNKKDDRVRVGHRFWLPLWLNGRRIFSLFWDKVSLLFKPFFFKPVTLQNQQNFSDHKVNFKIIFKITPQIGLFRHFKVTSELLLQDNLHISFRFTHCDAGFHKKKLVMPQNTQVKD